MDAHKAIGLFDSGVGGLSVVQEIFEQLPKESIIYFADTAHQPYGTKTKDELANFVLEIGGFLEKQKVKLIIIACNTADAPGLTLAQRTFAVPVVGVIEPGARAATGATRNKKIGIVGSKGLINSKAHIKSIKAIDSTIEVLGQPSDPSLVPFAVEEGRIYADSTRQLVKQCLYPLQKKNIDTLVLGSTHYPFLKEVIRDVLGPEVILVDPAEETVREVKKILFTKRLLYNGHAQPTYKFFTSGNPEKFKIIAEKLIKVKIPTVTQVKF